MNHCKLVVPLFAAAALVTCNSLNPLQLEAVLAAAPLAVKASYVQTVSFADARMHPELRQGYIDTIVANMGLPPYVTSVRYKAVEDLDAESKSMLENAMLRISATQNPVMYSKINLGSGKTMTLDDVGKKTIRTDVVVLPDAFNDTSIQTDEDFRSRLVDHEFAHARLFYENPTGFDMNRLLYSEHEYDVDIFNAIVELDGHQNELRHVLRGTQIRPGLSQGHLESMMSYSYGYYLRLWKPTKTNQEVVQELQERFYNPQFCVPESCTVMKRDPLVIALKDPTTGNLRQLPNSVVQAYYKH